jgi:hypothetical protein
MQPPPNFLLFWEAFPSLACGSGPEAALADLMDAAAQRAEPAPIFVALEEHLLERLPDPGDYATCDLHALRERCADSLRWRIWEQKSPVLTLRVPGEARELALEITRDALALGLCVFDSAIATCFRPGVRSQRVADTEAWLAAVDLTTAVDLDGDHWELFIRHAFVRTLAAGLLAAGFERMAGGAAFERTFEGGRQRVHVFGYGGRARVTLSTTHDAVQVLLERVAGPRAGASLATHTICLERLVNEPGLFKPEPEHLERALAYAERILRERGLNLLDRCQDLRDLDLMLNGPPALRWTGFGQADGRTALVVARLAGNPGFDGLCEAYRAQARSTSVAKLEEMELLIAALRDVEPLPERATPASLAARRALQPTVVARLSQWAHSTGLPQLAPTPPREDAATRFRAHVDAEVQRYRERLLRWAGDESHAADHDLLDALLRALLPLAESHGFRRIYDTTLVRRIEGGSQIVRFFDSISNASATLLYVGYGVSFDEVNEVYARAREASRYDEGGYAGTYYLEPFPWDAERIRQPTREFAEIDRYARDIAALFEGRVLPLFEQARTLEGLHAIDDTTKLSFFGPADREAWMAHDGQLGCRGGWPPVELVICHVLGDRDRYALALARHREQAAHPDNPQYAGGDKRGEQLEQLHAYLQEKVRPRR